MSKAKEVHIHNEIFKKIVGTGDINRVNDFIKKYNPLELVILSGIMVAAQNSNFEILEVLLAKYEPTLSIKNLILTGEIKKSLNCNSAIVKLILEKGADPKETRAGSLNNEAKELAIPILVFAAGHCNTDVVELLLDYGAEINCDMNKITPLLIASEKDNFKNVKLLLARGAELERESYNKATALNIANYYRNSASATLLIDNGANVEHRLDGFTPLMIATMRGTKDIVNALIKANADINAQSECNNSDHKGETALIEAVKYGKLDIARILIKHNANVNIKSNNGMTALMEAAKWERYEIIEDLLNAGAKTNSKNNAGKTALKIAHESQNKEIIMLLKGAISPQKAEYKNPENQNVIPKETIVASEINNIQIPEAPQEPKTKTLTPAALKDQIEITPEAKQESKIDPIKTDLLKGILKSKVMMESVKPEPNKIAVNNNQPKWTDRVSKNPASFSDSLSDMDMINANIYDISAVKSLSRTNERRYIINIDGQEATYKYYQQSKVLNPQGMWTKSYFFKTQSEADKPEITIRIDSNTNQTLESIINKPNQMQR